MASPLPSSISSPTPIGAKPASSTSSNSRMRLANVKGGRLDRPSRIVLYGVEGIGKSTFAAGAPSPVFIGTEDGTALLNVKRYPTPESWDDVLAAIDDLTMNPHEFRTAVLDTLDWMEPLLHAAVCAEGKKSSIEDFGFGRGYQAAFELARKLIARLDKLRDAKGMNIICLAHCDIRTFKNPEGDDYDRYEMKLHRKLATLFREWADATLFVNSEVTTYEKNQKTKGISTGKRVIYTEKRAAFDAKNRLSLPSSIDLDWGFAGYEAARKEALGLADEVDVLVARVEKADASIADKARSWLKEKPRALHELKAMKVKLLGRLEATEPPSGEEAHITNE